MTNHEADAAAVVADLFISPLAPVVDHIAQMTADNKVIQRLGRGYLMDRMANVLARATKAAPPQPPAEGQGEGITAEQAAKALLKCAPHSESGLFAVTLKSTTDAIRAAESRVRAECEAGTKRLHEDICRWQMESAEQDAKVIRLRAEMEQATAVDAAQATSIKNLEGALALERAAIVAHEKAWTRLGEGQPAAPPASAQRGGEQLKCNRCGVPHAEFVVPSDVWNLVVRLGGPEPDDEYICESCYRDAVAWWVREAARALREAGVSIRAPSVGEPWWRRALAARGAGLGGDTMATTHKETP